MRIKNRLYPYPVLRQTTGDYLHSTFKCNIDPDITSEACKLHFELICTNKPILQMISEGKASYAVHVECKYTYYRELIPSKDSIFTISIDSKKVDRAVEICPVIVADEDIVGYSNSDLDAVYTDEIIIIQAGYPLAIGNQSTIDICKEKDSLKKLSSPFCVLPYPDTPEQPAKKYATVNYSDPDQLIIYLSKEDHAILSRIQEAKNVDTIHAALYFPALIEAIDYMKTDASDVDQEKRWYSALNSKAVEKGLGEIRGNKLTAFELAQSLFGFPLSRWLKGYASESGGTL